MTGVQTCALPIYLALDVADGGEVLFKLAAISGTQRPLQLACIFGGMIENAAAEAVLTSACFRRAGATPTEQPLKKGAGIEHRRQRLCFASPGEIICVRARVTGIAVAGLPRALAAEVLKGKMLGNAVLPLIIDTPANRTSMAEADSAKWP